MTDIRPISSNSCASSLVLPSMALLTTLFISRALHFTKKSTTLLCLSAFTVTWIATSACADSPPSREEEEIDPSLNSHASHGVEEEEGDEEETEESKECPPWADDLLLNLEKMGLIKPLSDNSETERIKEIINKYADYPLSTYAVQKALSTLILQLYLTTEKTPQATYITCEKGVYPGFTLPPLVFMEEGLRSIDRSIVQNALQEYYIYCPPQKIWFAIDQAPPENITYTFSTTPQKGFFEQKLRLAGVQISKELQNFLNSEPDLNTQKDRAQLSELIWGNTTKKHTVEYNFCLEFSYYPVWEIACPPLLELDDLFTLTQESLLYLKNTPRVKLIIKDEALKRDRILIMPLHVAADFLIKLFPDSPRDYSLMEGGEISFSRSKNATQWQYEGYLTYGEWNFPEEEKSGYWPLKISE